MQTVTLPPGKIMYKFLIIFYLFLVRAAAAELWLTFQWQCRFKHWPESARADQIKPDLNLVKSTCFGLECL